MCNVARMLCASLTLKVRWPILPRCNPYSTTSSSSTTTSIRPAFVFQALLSFPPICAEPAFQSQSDDVLQQTVAFNTASWSLNVFVTHAMPALWQYWWMLPWGSTETAQEPLWWGQCSLWGDQSEQWAEIPKPGAQHTAGSWEGTSLHLIFPDAMGLQHQQEKREPSGFTHTAFNHLLPPGEVTSLWFVSGSTLLLFMQTFEGSLQ